VRQERWNSGLNRKGVMLVHAPTGDSELLFRGAPMSLLYAVSILADRLVRGTYNGWTRDDLQLYDPALSCVREPARAVLEVQQLLEHHRPAVVAIGATSAALFWALQIARVVKKWRKDCVVILGGPHEDEAGALVPGGSIADHSDIIDFSVQGDAEYLLAKLFDALYATDFVGGRAKAALLADPEAFNKMQGSGAINFALEGELKSITIGGRYRPGLRRGALIPLDLNTLPRPPRWLLESEHEYLFDIFRAGGRLKRTAQMLTTRGCDFGCTFCTERGAVSHRSVTEIMDEIHDLADQGYEAVFFDDSTLHLYPALGDLLDELCQASDKLGMEFGCLTRVDSLVKDLPRLPLGRFADAGFKYFYFGIEHDDDAVLEEMRKGYNSAKLHECLNLFRHSDQFRLGTSLLFGFRSETDDSIRRTLRLAATHPAIVIVNLSVVALHPAAALMRSRRNSLRHDVVPPNVEPEWDLFEEGRWFHREDLTVEYARKIHRIVLEVDRETNGSLIRKLKRGGNVLGPRTLHYEPTLDSTAPGTATVQNIASSKTNVNLSRIDSARD
jgi:radical SAM superfamily enzyme YgiQ (UPF0313 family)